MTNWKQTLIREAKEKEMCSDYFKSLSLCSDKITAIELYMSNPGWALKKDYPSFKVLREEFNLYGREGLYVDKRFAEERLDSRLYYVLHNCKGVIRSGLNVEKAVIPVFYVANGSEICFMSDDNVQIDIHVYSGSVVHTDGNAKFKILRH